LLFGFFISIKLVKTVENYRNRGDTREFCPFTGNTFHALFIAVAHQGRSLVFQLGLTIGMGRLGIWFG
jgi:hypothetical protein